MMATLHHRPHTLPTVAPTVAPAKGLSAVGLAALLVIGLAGGVAAMQLVIRLYPFN